MPPVVAPGVVELTLRGVWIDRPWNTVLHMDIDGSIFSDREDNIRDQAKIALNEWIDHIRPVCGANCVLQGCDYLDLDTLAGPRGTVAAADSPRVMPSAGTLTGDSLSGAACCLIRKITQGARGTRNGRIFMPGLVESQTNGNIIGGGSVTALTTAWDDFLAGMNQDVGGTFGFDSRMQVLHAPGDVFVSMAEVSTLEVDSRLATQRRRLRA